jgi:P4 family phage/plasmid primase-like protien
VRILIGVGKMNEAIVREILAEEKLRDFDKSVLDEIDGVIKYQKGFIPQRGYDSLNPTDTPTELINIEKCISSFTSKEHLAEQILDVLPMHYDESGIWWVWSNKEYKWEMRDDLDILNIVRFSSGYNTVNSKERSEILNALKQEARIRKPLEIKTDIIQFEKELVSLSTGKRFPASASYFITNPIPHRLGSSIDTPTIDRIFEEWVGKEHKQTLYEILAYCLLSDYPIGRIFCFIGGGSNGKSCFLNLLRKFVGEKNCCSTELDTLISSRFEVTRLHKKLVCQMGETNFGEMSKTSLLKKLSGKDLIGFEYKNKTPFEAINYAKIIIATNNLPATTDKTIGFYRRWMIIDFPNQFEEKKDILSEIPDEEYENLALKSLDILINLLKTRTFTNEGSIDERQRKYEDKSNPLEKFLKEEVVEDAEGCIFKWEFEKNLNEWCKANRFREISNVAIGKKMKELNMSQAEVSAGDFDSGKRWRAWLGIKWRASTG